MVTWVLLLGEREHPPEELPNGTATRPPQRVLLSAQGEVLLSAGFEQVVFGVDKLLEAGEIVPPATLVPLAKILRVLEDSAIVPH
jgi:hypothetical protein